MIMWRCVMATGGRLRYWVSSCFILIAFCVFFLMLWREWLGETNRNKLSFAWKEPRSSHCTGHPLVSPSRDVGCIHSIWSMLQAFWLQRLYSFLFQLEKWGREGSEAGPWLWLKMSSLEFCYCSFLSPGKNCQAVRMKQLHSSWPKLQPLFVTYLCLQIHMTLYFEPLYS